VFTAESGDFQELMTMAASPVNIFNIRSLFLFFFVFLRRSDSAAAAAF